MPAKQKKWSARVTATSDAMDVADGTFTQDDPEKIARAVEQDAERSSRRKSTPYRSAMSMLTFYINRAGSNLTAEQRELLERAKEVLRKEFGPKQSEPGKAPTKRATAKRARPAATAKTAAKRKKTTAKR
jgi:hypothetical protein